MQVQGSGAKVAKAKKSAPKPHAGSPNISRIRRVSTPKGGALIVRTHPRTPLGVTGEAIGSVPAHAIPSHHQTAPVPNTYKKSRLGLGAIGNISAKPGGPPLEHPMFATQTEPSQSHFGDPYANPRGARRPYKGIPMTSEGFPAPGYGGDTAPRKRTKRVK